MSQSESTFEAESVSRGRLTPEDHHEAPRLEPWLTVCLLAIVPMLVAFFIPKSLVMIAAAISGILLLAGVGMLVVQERRKS